MTAPAQPEPTQQASGVDVGACLECGRVNPEDARFCNVCGMGLRGAEPPANPRGNVDPLVGRIIAGRYRIDEVIGRGGMGVVYRVEHTRMGKLMAMKLLHGDLARDRESVRRFRREAEAVSKLDHANTVQVFDYGDSDGMTWLVMELLSGRDLGALLQAEGTIDLARAAHIAWQAAGSVEEAHERGIVHRDLKPENLRILTDRDEPDFVKVLDFGLAKLRESEDAKRASITREGFLVGTPYYMAPEHIRGEPVDARTDVYALGAVMYKAITGAPPFWAPTAVGVLTKHLTESPMRPRERSPRKDLPPEADAIVLRALEKDPSRRYQSMGELRDALAGFLESVGERPTSGRVPTVASEGPSRPQSPPTVEPTRRLAVATRDDVDRYERRIRAQSVLTRLFIAALACVAAGTSWWAWGQADTGPPLAEIEPNDDVASATELHLDLTVRGLLGQRRDSSHGDVDVWALAPLPAGARWLALETSGLPNADVALDLFVRGRPEPVLVVDGGRVGLPERTRLFPIDPRTTYLVRLREVLPVGAHPTENVSDVYTLTVRAIEPEADEEREPNEHVDVATPLVVGAAVRGAIGWNGDVDLYCLPDDAPAIQVSVSAISTLDVAMTIVDRATGRETDVDVNGPASGEVWQASAASPRCVRVWARAGALRADAASLYELRVAAIDP